MNERSRAHTTDDDRKSIWKPGRQNESTEGWRELTRTCFGSVTRTCSGLGSSPSTSSGPFIRAKGREPPRTGRSTLSHEYALVLRRRWSCRHRRRPTRRFFLRFLLRGEVSPHLLHARHDLHHSFLNGRPELLLHLRLL